MLEPCAEQPAGLDICLRVPAGTYSVMGWVLTKPAWAESDGDLFTTIPLHSALVGDPEVTVDADLTVVLDAREATEVEVTTPDHVTGAGNLGAAAGFSWARTAADGTTAAEYLLNPPGSQIEERLFMAPTDEVTVGAFSASSRFRLAAPEVMLEAGGTALHPSYYPPPAFSDQTWQLPVLDGELELPVVDAGTATPAELAGADLDGALALVRRDPAVAVAEQANAAAAAGARMVAVYHHLPGSSADPGAWGIRLDVPTVRLSHEEGLALLDRMAAGPLTATATGTPSSPYLYDLSHTEHGRIPAELSYVADSDELAAVERDFSVQVAGSLSEASWAFEPGADFSATWAHAVPSAPAERVDYYVLDPEIVWQHHVRTPQEPYSGNWPEPFVTPLKLLSTLRTYEEPGTEETSWLRQPLAPGFDSGQPMARQGDVLIIPTAGYVDADGNFAEAVADGFGQGYQGLFQVWHGDELIGEAGGTDLPSGTILLPPGEETFRIDYAIENRTPWVELSTLTRTSWTFVSATTSEDEEPAVVPLLTLDHDLGADLTNRLPGPRDRRGPNEIQVSAGHLAGADTRITGLTVEASYDDGDTWQTLRVRRDGDTFAAHLPNRPPRDNSGFVSFRFSAEDADGNRIDQEVIRAAALPAD
ncbi:PA domain-containing protein [Jiangella mangrovi]|uniref:PA domain-containing protein n=1 Tax=Jiangella mangrovi TaxID=1524084 RepID=A0A7W9LJU1_9ACTN|nr:PA domain-containing protein [Jiangella mangrovi]MBB5786475.1 hypothetical protein [Jiangella mangrovi]